MARDERESRARLDDSGWAKFVGRVALLTLRIRHAFGGRLEHTLSSIRRGEQAFTVVVAIVIGILGAYGAILFRELILLVHGGFFFFGSVTIDRLEAIPWWQRLLAPALGGLLVGVLVTRFAPEVKGSGIPEVMEAVARRGGLVRIRVILVKAAAAALTLGSGGSAGREGPIVHIGSAIGSAVGQLLQVSPRRLRTFVACGAAAGIAATFNAPIAGALFAVEVVLADLAFASLSPIVISSVVATVISRHYLGEFPALRVPAYQLADPFELVLYAGLGLAAGLLSVLFIKMLFGVGTVFERSKLPEWARPGIGGLGVGVIALALPHIHGVGYESIDAALFSGAPVTLLGLLVVAKLVATSLTLGSGGSGGVFAPSLFLGAMLGATIGTLVHWLFPEWTAEPGAYALVGMGAVVAGTTHAPITAILMIFEMTNDYRIIPPLMLACVIAILLSSFLHRESIYTEKLARRGIKLSEGRDVNLLRSIPVAEVMTQDAPAIEAGTPFSELVPILLASHHHELFVVDAEDRYMGSVSLNDIKALLPDSDMLDPLAIAADAVNEKVRFVLPEDNLDLVMHIFGRTHRDELPVCRDATSREVIGTIGRNAVIEAYNRRIFQLDLSGGFSSLVAAVQGGRTIEVVAGLHLAEVELPTVLVGKSLAEAGLRKDFELEVVLIRTTEADHSTLEGRQGKVPSAGCRLDAGDRLLVMGAPDAIERLQRWDRHGASLPENRRPETKFPTSSEPQDEGDEPDEQNES